jgi:hypothetical protein
MKCDYNSKNFKLSAYHWHKRNNPMAGISHMNQTWLCYLCFWHSSMALVQGSQNSTITNLPYKSGGHKKQASEDGSNFSSCS